jgi:predicted nucleic acid-binding Zn ribbon protein
MPSRRKKTDRGWLTLQRERYGPDFRPQPAHNTHAAGDLVNGVMKKFGMEADTRLAEITAVWEELAGEANAAHSRPGRWERGTLTVYVDHHVWLAEMQRFATRALESRLQERFGAQTVRRIRFQLDPDGPADTR